ncbi:MAG: hypothetical protein DBP02_19365 [gamma proteobacterium symbiont of Ctena orbiculata]|nr:MAG: hypothetical protein DBP02_19365 [gamma proteobacterium symbiont of Ctena orbiculata]
MKNKFRSLAIGIISSLAIAGCASSTYTKSDKQTSQIITNKNNSYIIFSRPELIGVALSNTIVEFAPNAEGMILVGTLGSRTKIIYEVPQGDHYFYMEGGENDDMIKITTGPGKVYYVHTQVNMGVVAGRFYFKPLRYSSKLLEGSLAGKECNEDILKKYDFGIVEEEYDFNPHDVYISDSTGLKIHCIDDHIKTVEFSGPSFETLEGSQLVVKNEEAKSYLKEVYADYQSEIEQDYPDWSKDNYGNTAMHEDDGVPIGKI